MKVEKARDRFDIPLAWRLEQEKRLVHLLAPPLAGVVGNREAMRVVAEVIPSLLDESARIAQEWLRRHQLGEKFVGWVDPSQAPEAE